MLKAIELYLVTDNNGLEAVDFYKEALGAEVVSCTTFGQAISDTPEDMKNLVLNANLTINGIRLQLSDNGPQHAYVQGTNMTACLQFDQADDATAVFNKLAVGAQAINLPLGETPWSPAYGIVVDKFGMTWQVNTDIPGYVSETVSF